MGACLPLQDPHNVDVDRDLYGDAMLVPMQMSTNMAARNQQKHPSLSFATTARIYLSRNSETLK